MADLDELQAIEPGDLLADRAYRQLSRAILRNQLVAGDALSVPELARRLNISRSPVREAVQRLIYDGLAANVPHRGAIVSELKPDDFRGLLEVRQALEGLAARLATERATDEQLRSLREVLDEHAVVVEAGDEDGQRRARHPLPQHHPRGGWQPRAQHDPRPDPGPLPTCPASRCGAPSATRETRWTSTRRSSSRWPRVMPTEPSGPPGSTSRTSSPGSRPRHQQS